MAHGRVLGFDPFEVKWFYWCHAERFYKKSNCIWIYTCMCDARKSLIYVYSAFNLQATSKTSLQLTFMSRLLYLKGPTKRISSRFELHCLSLIFEIPCTVSLKASVLLFALAIFLPEHWEMILFVLSHA